jgi:hypothetical protein
VSTLHPSRNPFHEARIGQAQDYRPEWDVPVLNRHITDTVTKQIREVAGRSEPDPGALISILLSAPGYGKSHLFGRIGHQLANEVFFVFVPAFEDVNRSLHHIRRHAVDSLFRSRSGQASPVALALARLCRESFVAYISAFPPSLRSRSQGVEQALREDEGKGLEIAAAVKEAEPFRKLAASIADRRPPLNLSYAVVKALALGWSPLGPLAHRWLLGEGLSEEEGAILGLDVSEPPSPLDVLRGIVAIFRYKVPMVLCCDQMEMVLKSPNGPRQVTAELIEILHQVPSQVLILSCIETEWPDFRDASYAAFKHRIMPNPFQLEELSEKHAVELVARRLKGWPNRPAQQTNVWPFDEPSLIAYVREKQPTPRVLIQRCGELFQPWFEDGSSNLLYLGKKIDDFDPARAFLQQWNHELDRIIADPECDPETYPEERMYRAVREALSLARDAKREVGEIFFRNIQEGAIKQGGKFTRYGLRVDIAKDGQPRTVLVPVYFHNNGTVFRFYLDAMLEAMPSLVAGALLVHRHAEFQMGTRSGERFEAERGKGRVRVFALEDFPLAFASLECLLRFLDGAVGKELVLGDLTLSVEDCRDFLINTAVLDNLDLFKQLGGWGRSPEAKPAAGVAAKPAAATFAVGSGHVTSVAVGPIRVQPSSSATLPPCSPMGSGGIGQPEPPSAKAGSPLDDHSRKFKPWAEERLQKLITLLAVWGQSVKKVEPEPVRVGPTFARLKVLPANAKTTFKKICDKATDMRYNLGLKFAPVIEPQENCISIDIQLPEQAKVPLAFALADAPSKLEADQPAFPVGVDVEGRAHWLNLADATDCHLLVAGTTGSGKSEFLRSLVAALATRLSYEQAQFFLVDPKRVTFNLGKADSPYLPRDIAYDAESALELLRWCSEETDRRYQMLHDRKLSNVSELADKTLIPRVVMVIDEFANLLEGKESKAVLTALLKRIGSMSRAAGIHLVLATQRPDKDVVIPVLRDNLPGRIALQVMKSASSELILNSPNAANLLGRGDLIWQRGGNLIRLQSPLVTQAEMEQSLKI